MGSVQGNVAIIDQEVSNNLLQSVTSTCQGNGTNIIERNTIISHCPEGNHLTQNATASVDCTMTSVLDQGVAVMMDAASQQTQNASKSWLDQLFTAQGQATTVKQETVNSLSQIISNQCQANSTNITRDNLIVCEGPNGGNYLDQTANASAKCVMTNTAKQTAVTDQTAKVKQEQTISSVFTAFAAMMIVGMIIFALCVYWMMPKAGGSSTTRVNGTRKVNKGAKNEYIEDYEPDYYTRYSEKDFYDSAPPPYDSNPYDSTPPPYDQIMRF